MEFKEQIASDREIFLNLDEFSEFHVISYKVGSEQITSNVESILTRGVRSKSLKEQSQNIGISTSYSRLYYRSEELEPIPRQGTLITIDGYRYTVTSIEEQFGVSRLTMEGYHQR